MISPFFSFQERSTRSLLGSLLVKMVEMTTHPKIKSGWPGLLTAQNCSLFRELLGENSFSY